MGTRMKRGEEKVLRVEEELTYISVRRLTSEGEMK